MCKEAIQVPNFCSGVSVPDCSLLKECSAHMGVTQQSGQFAQLAKREVLD